MRPLTQVAGLWRIGSTIAAMRYADGDRLKFLKGIVTDAPRTRYKLKTPWGEFVCPDVASAYQFEPSWEVEVKREIEKLHDGLFLDIGANIGFYSVLAGKRGNNVIAVEPNWDAYDCLSDNLVANLYSGFDSWPFAAWDRCTYVRLTTKDNTDISKVNPTHGDLVPAWDMDSLLGERKPSLIKIDVEGSEWNVLRGMEKTLRCRPKIIFEALDEPHLLLCTMLLKPIGYSVKALDSTNYLASENP